jgi:hypothetical protein
VALQVTSIGERQSPAVQNRLEDEKKFIAEARARFLAAEEAESTWRASSLDDFKFVSGDQWDYAVAQSRDRDMRPCLTMNRLRQFLRMVTNEQRQQRPSIQVNPVGEGSDIETAEIFQGIIRHIETNSHADIAYDTAFEHMTTGGFGYWRIITDYANDNSDDQEIFIKRIRNPFSVYFDPRCEEPDYSDAMFCFIVEDIPKELYREEYPNSELTSMEDWTAIGHGIPGWIKKETARVAEYFYVELVPEKRKGRNRTFIKRKVHWAKLNGIEILKKGDVSGNWITVVPVLGNDQMIDGRRDLVGLIRDAKDPQRQYNYFISASTETIALAPKSPTIIAEGQIEGHETEWEQSNRRNFATLTYKPISVAGQPVPVPQRNAAEPPIMAMATMVRQADNDLKATTGIYDASLGQQGPEQSGKAVLARQKQSDIANLGFTDNLARALRFTGRILVDMIPEVYDQARVQRIIQPDGKVKHVGVYNSQTTDRPEPMELPGVSAIYDIGNGSYDVSVSVGPSYQSKRQEAVASQLALVQSFPQLMQVAGDLIIRNMDWPGAGEIADRMQKMLPPMLQDQQQQAIQQTQQQVQQLQQQNQALLMAVQQLNTLVQQKHIESQTKMTTALIDQETKLNVARITASKDRDVAGANQEMAYLQSMHDSAHDTGMQAMQQQHEQGMQGSDQMHEAAMSQMPSPQPQGPPEGPPAPGGQPPTPPQQG